MLATSRPRADACTPASVIASARRHDLALPLELLRAERFAEASALVDTFPDDPDVLLLRAVLCAHGGDFARAEDACRRLLEADELDAGAHYVLALCREGAADHAGAVHHHRAAVYLDAGFAMPRLHLGILARRTGDRAVARRELTQASALLAREDASRLLLFGGGFGREALTALCRAELLACGGSS